MDRRLAQGHPLSRDQVAAIFRQRAERNMDALRRNPHPQRRQDAAAAAAVEEQGVRRRHPAAMPPPPQPMLPAVGPQEPEVDLMMRAFAGQGNGGAAVAAALAAAARLGRGREAPPSDEEDVAVRMINVAVEGEVISYMRQEDKAPTFGLYVGGQALSEARPYFEVEILDKGSSGVPGLILGVCSLRFPLDVPPGWASESVGFNTSDGTIFRGRPRGQASLSGCEVGDRIGCGWRPAVSVTPSLPMANVYFTRNGKEVVAVKSFIIPPGGFFPAICLQNPGDEVAFRHGLTWSPEEDMMVVDGGEDEWARLHDVHVLEGSMIEYLGRGKSLEDVGLAQAKLPISTRNHYFEIEIVDPGASCYIAIGLARKDYPRNRHPGWNKGSIAYHADDGKVFVGSGVGSPFGPRCHKGDIMGCGVLFPRNYQCKSDSDEELEQQGGGVIQYGARENIEPDYVQIEDFGSDSTEEEEDWWNDQVFIQSGVRVQVIYIFGAAEIAERLGRSVNRKYFSLSPNLNMRV